MKNFKKVAIGGTFDLLHAGHKSLITKAFEVSDFVYIGLTTDKFNQKYGKITYQNQKLRINNLEKFLNQLGGLKKTKIIPLKDIYGIASTNPSIQAIVVTKETEKNAQLINLKRAENGLEKLEVILIPFKRDQNKQIISSSSIRLQTYKKMLSDMANHRLKEMIRRKFKKPFGKIVKIDSNIKLSANFITVGDIVTKKAIEVGVVPKLSIVDFKTHREQVFTSFAQLGLKSVADYKVVNKPGTISKSLVSKIERCLKDKGMKQVIFIKGEEDLAVVPLVLLSPLGTDILYGQPGRGAVLINVNQDTKNKLYKILRS